VPDPKAGLAPEERPRGVGGNVEGMHMAYGKKMMKKKSGLTAKQKTLPKALQSKIIKAKKKKK
jgi:hypothetical protein